MECVLKVIASFCAVAFVAAGPALADPEGKGGAGGKITDAEIRSGNIVDDGLDIPRIRPGTQYFEINGSTRIARALGEYRLPTDDAGLSEEHVTGSVEQVAAW